ncbi:hypothetical protein B0H14DRAFT_3907752 [Mycena olivaceomarginata]|nr:hypothetical protein B0H14DRAFT_3907752 [Mycena olivaceomarginata]
MYSVRTPGLKSALTAAVYQGDGAEEQWRAEISRYSELRHPYLFQLYGIASARGLHAVVFHDDLIPWTELRNKYRNAHFSTVFFWACMLTQYQVIAFIGLLFNSLNILWQDVAQYILSFLDGSCIDLTPPESSDDGLDLVGAGALSATSVLDPPEDSQIIASISLEAYHHVCYRHPKQWHLFPIFQDTSVKVGSIRHFPAPEYENSFEIAFTPDCVVGHRGWLTEDSTTIEDRWNPIDVNEGTSILENGVNSANVVDEYRRYIYADDFCVSAWLAHANYILNLLGIKSNFEDYLVVFRIDFWVKLLGPIVTLPPGYLFICPWAQLETELPGFLEYLIVQRIGLLTCRVQNV